MNSLKLYNIAKKIKTLSFKKSEVLQQIRSIPVPEGVFQEYFSLKKDYSLKCKACIVDFEGRIFMSGFLLGDSIVQFYVKCDKDMDSLISLTLNTMEKLKGLGFVFFSFSEYEQDLIKEWEIGGKKEALISIINLQKNYYESLIEALFKIGIESSNDPLFRDIKLINRFYIAKQFGILLGHNRSCLKSEASIFKKRWLKLFLI